VVLNFWGSWCFQCRLEHGDLSRTATAYEGKGVRFYGILYNDEPANARRWIAELGGQSYPTLLDDGSRTAIEYGIYGAPETFIIDQSGMVVHKQIGPITTALLSQLLNPLLSQGDAS
jgi:cytochrome c biogenesis protein CcmG/thiol:disulfide interchange protein DsbE